MVERPDSLQIRIAPRRLRMYPPGRCADEEIGFAGRYCLARLPLGDGGEHGKRNHEGCYAKRGVHGTTPFFRIPARLRAAASVAAPRPAVRFGTLLLRLLRRPLGASRPNEYLLSIRKCDIPAVSTTRSIFGL